MRDYLPLIQKDSGTHMHGLAVYVKGLSFARDLSLENSTDCYVFDWLYFTQCLTSFSSIDHLLQLCAVFDSISSNIDEVLLSNPSANVFVFGDFNIHHKAGLPILEELINLVNSVITFPSQMTLLR